MGLIEDGAINIIESLFFFGTIKKYTKNLYYYVIKIVEWVTSRPIALFLTIVGAGAITIGYKAF